MRRGLIVCLVLAGLLAGCQAPSSPEAALKAVDGEVIHANLRPNSPIVEVKLVDPYAACPPFLVFHYVSDRHLAPLQGLDELKKLAILSDNVTDAGLANLAGLTTLESLDLDLEKITDAGMAELRDLTNLRELRIVGSRIGDAGWVHLGRMNRIESLELGCWYKTTPKGLAPIAQMPALKRLKVQGISFDDDRVAVLANLTALEQLDVPFHNLTDAGLAHLRNLTALKGLDLRTTPGAIGDSDNLLTDDGLAHLEKLTALETLHLPRGIGDGGLAHLRGLTNLKRLSLWHTSVTDEGLLHVAALSQLELLELPRATVTDEGVEALQQALPDLKIEIRDVWLPPLRRYVPPSPPGS